MPDPFDPMCGRTAVEVGEYHSYAEERYNYYVDKAVSNTPHWSELTDEAKATEVNRYVRNEEGTYNQDNGHFLCTDCYIKAGMPSSSLGWVCP
jgi:hypothetical protein